MGFGNLLKKTTTIVHPVVTHTREEDLIWQCSLVHAIKAQIRRMGLLSMILVG